MGLAESRRAIHPLLDQRSPIDAQAVYYACYHPDEKTQLVTMPAGEEQASGYVCLSRTGIDLFRPLITMRLPLSPDSGDVDPLVGADLIYEAMSPGTDVILSAPTLYRPLLHALFDVQREELLNLYVLDRALFEPIINILVIRSETYNGLPRFIIRQTGDGQIDERGEIIASAGVNWRSPYFAEIYVHTKTAFRRQGLGRSLVASLVQDIIKGGRTPLYVVKADNEPSIQLAESVGFIALQAQDVLIEGILKPHPLNS